MSSLLKPTYIQSLMKVLKKKIKDRPFPAALIGFWCSLSIIMILLGYKYPSFLLSKEDSTIQYIFSSTAQAMAAIYGLSITGYIFLSSSLKKEKKEEGNAFKVYPIERLLNTNFLPILLLSIVCTSSILLSLLSIIVIDYNYSIFIFNIAGASTITGLVFIFIFIKEALDPLNIINHSKRIFKETMREIIDNLNYLYIDKKWVKLSKNGQNNNSILEGNPSLELLVLSSRDTFALINIKLQIIGVSFMQIGENKNNYVFRGLIDAEKNDLNPLADGLENLEYYENLADLSKFYIFDDKKIAKYLKLKIGPTTLNQIEEFKSFNISRLKAIIKCLGLLVIIDPSINICKYDKNLYDITKSFNVLLSEAGKRLDNIRIGKDS